MERAPIGWAQLLAVLAGAALAQGCGDIPHSHPPGHPCWGKNNCESYLLLPDGAVAPRDHDAGVPDGGQLRICGACNG